MNEYNEDYYLLDMIHEHSDEATEILYQRYKQLIRYKSYKYLYTASKLGLDLEDLTQEGLIGLSQAVNDYANHKNVLFSTFANLCIEREIQSAVKTASRKKHSLLNESVSIEKEIVSGIDFTSMLSNKQSAEDVVIEKLFEIDDINMLVQVLTPFEEKVFWLKYQGFDYLEIASVLNKSSKSIDNAIQRIKRKSKDIFD